MSDFTVLRSLDGYCLVLDKKRIAGGKPDYRGNNVLVDWTTKVAYGPVDDLAAENAKLRELVWDLYCLAYPSAVEWEASDAAYDKYSPCKKCHELHGGKSPCASATKDMTEECCAPIQAAVVADHMRELGVEV